VLTIETARLVRLVVLDHQISDSMALKAAECEAKRAGGKRDRA
jgi:hypothetical protein